MPKYLWAKADGEVAGAYAAKKQRFPGRPTVMSTVEGMLYR